MKNLTFLIFIFTFYLTVTNACKSEDKNRDNIVASIDDENLYIEEIDLNVKQELYNELYKIYLIRKKQVDKTINRKIILLEAQKYHISADSLLNHLIIPQIDSNKFLSLEGNIHNEIIGNPNPNKSQKKNMSFLPENQNNRISKFNEYQLKKYLDSLRVLYKVTINLQPPKIPNEIIDRISMHCKGNMKSPVTVWLISDLECSSCKEAKPIYDTIFKNYNGKIKIAYSYFSDAVTISSLALECASTQNKFWEMYNYLDDAKKIPSLNSILNIGEKIGLNMKTFISEIQDSTTYYKILYNFERISNAGFLGTPMVVINGKVISNPTSKEEIENIIEYELSGVK